VARRGAHARFRGWLEHRGKDEGIVASLLKPDEAAAPTTTTPAAAPPAAAAAVPDNLPGKMQSES
jgi:hypothetical protein